jgi:hypothetical protein
MKKTIIAILGICLGSCLMAQSPCDPRLADQTRAKLEPTEEFLKIFDVSSTRDEKLDATFQLLLNKSVKYGFTIHNSILSKQVITFKVSDKNGTIEEKIIPPGHFEHILFNCQVLDAYYIIFTSENPGVVCANAIMSYVTHMTTDQK